MYDEKDGRFLMAAKKRAKNKTSNYLICMDPDPTDRSSSTVVGKLRANWTGSAYILYDHLLNPEKAATSSTTRRELAVVGFDYDKMGPGKMRVGLPRVSSTGVATLFRPSAVEVGRAGLAAAGNAGDKERVMFLTNKQPQWDDKLNGYVLNFAGRVTQSSVKNFQLASEETGDATLLQFGRVGKHRFNMDWRAPLSPLQAFGVVLASLDGKLADNKNFERIKKLMKKSGETPEPFPDLGAEKVEG
jgi:hypothetical protein